MSDSVIREHERYIADPRGYAAALPPDRFATPADSTSDLPVRPALWRSVGAAALGLGFAAAWQVLGAAL